jgi:hypothetical protein
MSDLIKSLFTEDEIKVGRKKKKPFRRNEKQVGKKLNKKRKSKKRLGKSEGVGDVTATNTRGLLKHIKRIIKKKRK